MNPSLAAFLQISLLVALLASVYRVFGDYLAGVYASAQHNRIERWTYRLVGVDPEADQRWGVYARSVAAFSLIGVGLLYLLLRAQALLPWSLGHEGMPALQAFNTAVSFVTNTNWQSYSGEQALGYAVPMLGLTVQNFLSAAVGMSVAIAVIRGLTRENTDRLGNFWVDLTRTVVRVLLPGAFVFALILLILGTIQTFRQTLDITTLTGGQQSIPGGPVASQESIKELGTNGGGFFNANSAHPYENPSAWTNVIQLFLILVIPFSLPRTFGRMVGDLRQGRAILAVMSVLWLGSVAAAVAAEMAARGPVAALVGSAMEGKEVRFGVPMSAVYAATTTATSTGAVDAMHSSMTGLGGGVAVVNMLLGEVSPGGTGSGLYGMLVIALVTVFLAGLMVGRTPEYLGKRLRVREMKLIGLYILTTPALVLLGLGIAMATDAGKGSILNPGPHGLAEVLYAFASAANNNGSAFAGLNANTDFYNVALGVAMLFGRLVPILIVLALAGSLAAQRRTAPTEGTLPTHGLQFVVLTTGVVLLVAGLTFVPALALGPLAEGLS